MYAAHASSTWLAYICFPSLCNLSMESISLRGMKPDTRRVVSDEIDRLIANGKTQSGFGYSLLP